MTNKTTSAIDLVEREVCWLVECPEYHPGEYFSLCECGCGRHYWEADVHKATRFRSKEEAETARGGDVNCIAVEHEFGLKLPRRGSLLERLTSHEIMPGMPRLQKPINPDGPEAADTITRLRAALDYIGDLAKSEALSDSAKVILIATKVQLSSVGGE